MILKLFIYIYQYIDMVKEGKKNKVMSLMEDGICKTITYNGSLIHYGSKFNPEKTTLTCSVPRGGHIVVLDAYETIYNNHDLAYMTIKIGDRKLDFWGRRGISKFLIPIRQYPNARIYITYYTDVDMEKVPRNIIFKSYKIKNSWMLESFNKNGKLLEILNPERIVS